MVGKGVDVGVRVAATVGGGVGTSVAEGVLPIELKPAVFVGF
jgi:hypothetical protein